MMRYYSIYSSPLGKLLIVSSKSELLRVQFYKKGDNFNITAEEPEVILKTKLWLDSYFGKENPKIEIPLKLIGTNFQLKVWDLLLKIPYGKTVTYKDIAKNISSNMTAQAVGQAVAKNPIAIIVPCHRVIGSDGLLTGYAGGIENKKRLLDLEKV